ncbi:MAG: hypothetical protein LC753_14375 [Acidobacteria bacterium]|nr:hypothetical protein [Acidobacteriota bacterium]MCA1651403.1 hypothetical protein [Acidobacteriota bacterium]
MIDPIREMKIRAAILQRRIVDRQPSALARLRALPEFRARSIDQLEMAGMPILRRHCLAILARELGFAGWPHAKDVISGARDVSDFGTVLYPKRCCGHLNLWYSRYDDAAIGHRASGGYLLAYRRQFMVVHSSFIETLGLGPPARRARANAPVRSDDRAAAARGSLVTPVLGPTEARVILDLAALPALRLEHMLTRRVTAAIPPEPADYRLQAGARSTAELARHIVSTELRFFEWRRRRHIRRLPQRGRRRP